MQAKATVFFFVLIFFSVSYAQNISDREADNLMGFVKSVREENAEIIFRNGKPSEQSRKLVSVKTFDISGKLTTDYNYSDNNEILDGDTYHYDSNGRLTEKTTKHSKYSNLCDKYKYSYNKDGQLFEEICYVDGKGQVGKYINRYDTNGRRTERERTPIQIDKLYFDKTTLERYRYDESGKRVEQTLFVKENGEWKPKPSSSDKFKSVYFSNENTRVSTELKYDQSGILKFVEVGVDDGKGNELETVTHFTDGSIKDGNRYEYRFDQLGNPIKESNFEWVTLDGRSFFQLSDVTYRTFEYYSKREVAEYKAKSGSSQKKQIQDSSNQVSDREEYAIFNVLIKDWITDSQVKQIIIDRYTNYRDFGGDDTTAFSVDGLEKEIADDFISKNSRKQYEILKKQFPIGDKIILINQSETGEIFSDREKGWKFFYQKYPKSQGITTISRVGFNKERTKALVYMGTQSDWLAGAGYLIILQKDANEWKIVDKRMTWIS
ncbi:MAG: hypothetical protein WBO10_06160 [Pyrinomonadaceae bacterium]